LQDISSRDLHPSTYKQGITCNGGDPAAGEVTVLLLKEGLVGCQVLDGSALTQEEELLGCFAQNASLMPIILILSQLSYCIGAPTPDIFS
jgi:hypothetical protein